MHHSAAGATAAPFCLGVLLLLREPSLPDGVYVQVLPVALALALRHPGLRPMAIGAAGYLWAALVAHIALGGRLPVSLEGADLVVTGVVAGLPASEERRTRFDFEVTGITADGIAVPWQGRARLNWYMSAPELRPGESWQLRVRLRPPRGLRNPGGFDYARWLLLQRIDAVGYVREAPANARVAPVTMTAGARIDATRHELGAAMDRVAAAARRAEHPHIGVLRALVLGDRTGLGPAHWKVFAATGTGHLIAISGLHIGLLAGLVFFALRNGWARAGPAALWIAAPRFAAVAAVAAAIAYAGLAGFTVPTQRALVMVAVLMLGLVRGHHPSPVSALSAALLAVLVWDPLAPLGAGFWLSFGAVAAIAAANHGRLGVNRGSRAVRLWWAWGRTQCIVVVALAPLTLLLFQEQSISAPLANAVAIPWVAFAVVPAALLSGLLALLLPSLAEWPMLAALAALDILWPVLRMLAEWDPGVAARAPVRGATLALAVAGVVLALTPRGFPLRAGAVLLLVPVFVVPAERPPPGGFWLTVLDVGQGLANVVRTERHTLVFDTGPRFGPRFDAGAAVVTPFLREVGGGRVDIVVVSHADSDHIGGLESVRAGLAPALVLASPGALTASRGNAACHTGRGWTWDGVRFDFIHPPAGHAGSRNDTACVLRVAGPGGAALLGADIEGRAERWLVRNSPGKLAAEVLVVPHHGSNTSSTEAFIDAVGPRLALLSRGHRNRHGHPHPKVSARYRDRGIPVFDTARLGAISVRFHPRRGPSAALVESPRRFWTASRF